MRGLFKAQKPKPHVLSIEALSDANGKSSHEAFAVPSTLGRMREVPWASNLLTELQRERKKRLFSLVDPSHMPQREQFGWSPEAMLERYEQFGWSSDALVQFCRNRVGQQRQRLKKNQVGVRCPFRSLTPAMSAKKPAL